VVSQVTKSSFLVVQLPVTSLIQGMHLLHKVLPSFQCPDKEQTILSEIQGASNLAQIYDMFRARTIYRKKKPHFESTYT